MIKAATDLYPWPWIQMRPGKLVELCKYLQEHGEVYGLGSKITPLAGFTDPDKKVDCSGFVRWGIYHATAEPGPPLTIPDGSVNQHDWCIEQGFKVSDYDACKKHDGAIRIAFLAPDPIGHVALVANGMTIESHGGVGPDMRMWGSQGWMRKCSIYVLTPPAIALR